MTDFALKLLDWYRINKRDLPWRETNDPYKIWLSEIIMQQTQVIQGESYYLKFVTNYPTVKGLAMASEEDVLKLWQGLGYYSRARNLHTTAKYVASELNGVFPSVYNEILKLKGVGPYTAAAIASFCFELPHAVVDGNVYRFIARLKGINTPIDSTQGKKEFALLADELLNRQNPGEHNQAMMEFGALACKAANPLCETCPFFNDCAAIAQDMVEQLPVKQKKVKQRKRYFHYFFIEEEGSFMVEKRLKKDIWQNLYQLPLIESKTEKLELNLKKMAQPLEVCQRKHILSHQVIYATFYIAQSAILDGLSGDYVKVDGKAILKFPFPQLIANFLNERIRVHQD